MNENRVNRVAVLGPESSGKSELCQALAARYSTTWIPEYARKFLEAKGRDYSLDDIVYMYTEQLIQEQAAIDIANKFLFTDTEMIIALVWCKHVFGEEPRVIAESIERHPYDYYLLTSPDLPWEPDPLRENPGKGEFFFKWYRDILESRNLPYGVVSGTGEKRTENAVALIKSFFQV